MRIVAVRRGDGVSGALSRDRIELNVDLTTKELKDACWHELRHAEQHRLDEGMTLQLNPECQLVCRLFREYDALYFEQAARQDADGLDDPKEYVRLSGTLTMYLDLDLYVDLTINDVRAGRFGTQGYRLLTVIAQRIANSNPWDNKFSVQDIEKIIKKLRPQVAENYAIDRVVAAAQPGG